VSAKGAYVAPNDCPKYVNKEGAQYGPNCGQGSAAAGADAGSATVLPNLPASVQKDLASFATSGSATPSPADAVVGSPQEQDLISAIVGKVTDAQAKSSFNSTSVMDLLLGPMLRGTTVSATGSAAGGQR